MNNNIPGTYMRSAGSLSATCKFCKSDQYENRVSKANREALCVCCFKFKACCWPCFLAKFGEGTMTCDDCSALAIKEEQGTTRVRGRSC